MLSTPSASPSDAVALPGSTEWFEQAEREARADRRRAGLAVAIAVVLHALALFVVRLAPPEDPEFGAGPRPAAVYVMEPVRFKKPPAPPRAEKKATTPRRVRKIPIPDPTPDDPEPIETELESLPEIDLDPLVIEAAAFGEIPDAPASGPSGTGGTYDGEVYEIGGGISPPKGISRPNPPYTEDARQARIEGVVVLSAVIDPEGRVRALQVLRGLPGGLSESALETVSQWTFEPSRREDGTPVAVNYLLTVSFSLQ